MVLHTKLRRKEILKSNFKNALGKYTILIWAIRSQRPVNKIVLMGVGEGGPVNEGLVQIVETL